MWLNYTGDRIFVLPGNPFSARLCQIVISIWQQKYKIYTKKHLLLDYLWIFIIPDKICVISQAVQSYVPITKLNCGHFYLYEEHLSDCCPLWLLPSLAFCSAVKLDKQLKVTAPCFHLLGHTLTLDILEKTLLFKSFSQRGSLCYSILIPGGQIQSFCLMLLAFQRSFVL